MTEAEMATGCEKTKYGDDEPCDDDDKNRLEDYSGESEEGGEVKTETTKEPITKRTTMTPKATKNTIIQ